MTQNGSFSQHYKSENKVICNTCSAHITGDVITHMINAHCGSYFYTCHLCRNYSGSVVSGLFQHQRDKHDVSNYYIACPICFQYVSLQEKDVMSHVVNVHSRSENVYACKYCSFKSKTDLEVHFKGAHSRYQCVFHNCQSISANSTNLFKHYISHHFPNLTLFYGCRDVECDAMFSNENSLYQHQWDKHGIEEDENEEEEENETFIELGCRECPFTTLDKRSYEKHSISKHPNRFFDCTFMNCNYQTKLFRSIIQHTFDKHLSETFVRYNCFVCEEMSYDQIHSLIQHLRDKHYVFDECSMCCLSGIDDLAEHIWSEPDHSHNVFKCKTCSEEYYEKDELTDHISDDHGYFTPLLKSLCFGD